MSSWWCRARVCARDGRRVCDRAFGSVASVRLVWRAHVSVCESTGRGGGHGSDDDLHQLQ
jgi:hypothetical protein